MGFSKVSYYGNVFVGIFARTNDKLTLMPKDVHPKFVRACEEALKTEVREVSIAGSNLIGIFSAMNSNGIVVPQFIEKEEVHALKKLGLNVHVLKSKYTAIGNNVSVNDKAALVNPYLEGEELKKISDCLGVEVFSELVAGFHTVGAACAATNRGFLAHNDIEEGELEEIEDMLKVRGGLGTANLGVTFIGTSLIANSNGCVVGEQTSGFEMQRISEALNLM